MIYLRTNNRHICEQCENVYSRTKENMKTYVHICEQCGNKMCTAVQGEYDNIQLIDQPDMEHNK